MPRQFNANDYIDVQQRITRFWEEYPDGRIETQLMSLPDDFDRVVFIARVWKHRVPYDAEADVTGWAAEEKGADYKAGANFTSWHENCETSAIGRALANMGYATSGKDRPSKEEMSKVNRAGPTAEGIARELTKRDGIDRTTGEITDPRELPEEDRQYHRQRTGAKEVQHERGLATPEEDPVIGQSWISRLWIIAGEKGIKDTAPDEPDELHDYIMREFQKASTKQLTVSEAQKTADWLKGLPPKQKQLIPAAPARPDYTR